MLVHLASHFCIILLKSTMRVHFGGTVTRLKEYPKQYVQIVKTIKELKHELMRDWVTEELSGITAPVDLMYEYTLNAIKNSEAVVLEDSFSSTAVGQQLMIALQNNIPVLLLRSKKLTKDNVSNIFISKNLSKLVSCKRYTSRNIKGILKKFFEKTAVQFSESRFNLVIDKKLDKYLKELAKKNQSSKSAEIRRLIVEKMLLEDQTKVT